MIRKYFIAGLLFWIPIIVTFLIIQLLFDVVVALFSSLPQGFHPDEVFGVKLPGVEFVIIALLVWLSGVFAANFLGKRLVHWGERVVSRIPLIRTIYSGVKQTLQIMVSPNSQAFRQVVMISFPFPGSSAIGLVTNKDKKSGSLTVFVPTTPNPTSGYVVIVSKEHAKKLDMTVDEALKYIISLGTISHISLEKQLNAAGGE